METIEVLPDGGERYLIGIRGHQIAVDQPGDGGGADTAPSPTELFVAGLVSCVAYYAGRYLTRHRLSRDGMRVTGSWEFATDRPARVSVVKIEITPPVDLPADKVPALLAVAGHCTVHNSIVQEPEISIDVVAAAPARSGGA